MPPQTKFYRQIKLMEVLQWEGERSWTEFNQEFQVKGRLKFEWWLKEHLNYLSPEIREVCYEYFFKEDESKPNSMFYRKKDQGVEALRAMYKLEQKIG